MIFKDETSQWTDISQTCQLPNTYLKGITLVVALRSGRAGIPNEMKEARSDPVRVQAYYRHITQISIQCWYHVIKAKPSVKDVLVLISMHKNVLTAREERKKPHVITFYDRTKSGIDVMDMMTSPPQGSKAVGEL